MNINDHLGKLGWRVRDRVTGFRGVATTVGFDLYGCVQVIVTPEVNEKGETGDGKWLDMCRIELLGDRPVMPRPDFTWTPESVAAGNKGPAEKPSSYKP